MQKIEHASDHGGDKSHHYFETRTGHAWGVSVLFYLLVIIPVWMAWEVIRFLAGW